MFRVRFGFGFPLDTCCLVFGVWVWFDLGLLVGGVFCFRVVLGLLLVCWLVWLILWLWLLWVLVSYVALLFDCFGFNSVGVDFDLVVCVWFAC